MDDVRQVPVDPAHARQVVAELLDSLGLDGWRWTADPFSKEQVVDFARRLGYDVTPRTLGEFTEKRYVSDPGEVWDATAFFCFIHALESRRRWQPTPNPHDLKKSAVRLEVERNRAAGVRSFTDLGSITLEDLLIRLVGCDHAQIREGLYEAVKAKLASLGFLEE